jgi:hypothetical protein
MDFELGDVRAVFQLPKGGKFRSASGDDFLVAGAHVEREGIEFVPERRGSSGRACGKKHGREQSKGSEESGD